MDILDITPSAQRWQLSSKREYVGGPQRSCVTSILAPCTMYKQAGCTSHTNQMLLYARATHHAVVARCSPPDRFQQGTSAVPAAAFATLLELPQAPKFDIWLFIKAPLLYLDKKAQGACCEIEFTATFVVTLECKGVISKQGSAKFWHM